jgi:hypothetical protein
VLDPNIHCDHAMLCVPPMPANSTSTYSVSFRVTKSSSIRHSASQHLPTFGLIAAGHHVTSNFIPHGRAGTGARGASCISTANGGLSALNGNRMLHKVGPGRIPYGAVLTMTVDFALGTLTFMVDGVAHGTGFRGIQNTYDMQWVVSAPLSYTKVEIVETAVVLTSDEA